jgi:PTH1 family peptidyl-tRNA hydrolase
MKLIVGLGNPGRKYEHTRHNVGFAVLERLARRGAASSPRAKFQGEICEAQLGGDKVLLLAPHTYMNLSGASVRQAFDFYKLELADLLVICDDFQLPLGQLRIRGQGSDGGQKGLADVIAVLGDEFARLRIGIGPVPPAWQAVDFVLGKFAADEQPAANAALDRASDAAVAWVREGLTATMNQYNRKASP